MDKFVSRVVQSSGGTRARYGWYTDMADGSNKSVRQLSHSSSGTLKATNRPFNVIIEESPLLNYWRGIDFQNTDYLEHFYEIEKGYLLQYLRSDLVLFEEWF